MTIRAFIAGCSGLSLTADERAFFRDAAPWGFILFKRNIDSPAQVLALTQEMREVVGRADAPVLIDQEGGRVQRMGPPHWPKYPPGRAYGLVAGNDPSYRREIARLGARLMAHDLRAVGIDVDCVPVLDVPVAGAHDVIGDRAYGRDPETVAVLGRAAAEGLIAGGVLPVIKHITTSLSSRLRGRNSSGRISCPSATSPTCPSR
jgi:beta-N-acetylhexosaminidase